MRVGRAPQAQFPDDLYQDLPEYARKKYALLQTPEFVVDFILDRTLTPAIDEFGLKGLRLIDPACGSGHFLLMSCLFKVALPGLLESDCFDDLYVRGYAGIADFPRPRPQLP